MIIQREFSPSPLLSGIVRYYFIFEPTRSSVERVTPNGTVQISFQLKPGTGNGERFYVLSRFSKLRFVKPSDLGRCIGICFYPWAIRPFLKVPQYELTDKKISLEDIFGSKIKALHEQIINCRNFKEAIAIIESHLINAISGKEFDRVVANAAVDILKSNGSVGVEKLHNDYNISERRLQQRFNEVLGISPKLYCRLTRFQYSLSHLNSGTSLTDVAYKCGYFDQSHFIRDFKLFAGITPKEYLSEKHSVDDVYATAPSMI